MKTLLEFRELKRLSLIRLAYSTLILTAMAVVTTGCGSSSAAKTPPLSGNTNVTVMVTSTSNDQLTDFDFDFQGITLTSQSGKTVTLLSALPQGLSAAASEFMHINGTAEPLVTASIPQDVYTAATVTVFGGQFVCIYYGSIEGELGIDTSTYNAGLTGSAVTVNLASPITVTGASMGLAFDLQVAQSATYSACVNPDGTGSAFSITPTFNLTPLAIAASPTNATNGKVMGLDGQISALGTTGNSFTLTLSAFGVTRTLAISSDGTTAYQGIGGFSALAVGTLMDMDGAVQPDGSLLATRIAVEDPSAADEFRGPLLMVTPSASAVLLHLREQQGNDLPGYIDGSQVFDYSSATFQISGQLANLSTLPFVPSFSASNMVPGQEVYLTNASYPLSGYPVVTTMTLMPQIIDGTVTASTQSGSFTDYTVSLAAYDLFPLLAVQPGQTAVENNPSQIEVYVDSNTQLLNTTSTLAEGSTLRFYGIVFNDGGTLRMDCAQVNDGVSFTPAPNANSHLRVGSVQTLKRASSGGSAQVMTTITQTH